MEKLIIPISKQIRIFIDSNIFIDSIRFSEKDFDDFINEIRKNKNHLIFTEQGVDEVLRNMSEILNSNDNYLIKSNYFILEDTYKTRLINSIFSSEENEKFKSKTSDLNKEINQRNENIKNSLRRNASKLKAFFNSLRDDEFLVLERSSEIINKAYHRKLSGNPPKSKGPTIGDEIIWETLLSWAKSDIILVSNDNTFTIYKDFLQEEYRKRDHSLIDVYKDIESAFKVIGTDSTTLINLSKTLEEFIEAQEELRKNMLSSFEPLLEFYKNINIPIIKLPMLDLSIFKNLEIDIPEIKLVKESEEVIDNENKLENNVKVNIKKEESNE